MALSFRVRGTYPRYNEFADKMPPEVVEKMEEDRKKDVARWWDSRDEILCEGCLGKIDPFAIEMLADLSCVYQEYWHRSCAEKEHPRMDLR